MNNVKKIIRCGSCGGKYACQEGNCLSCSLEKKICKNDGVFNEIIEKLCENCLKKGK